MHIDGEISQKLDRSDTTENIYYALVWHSCCFFIHKSFNLQNSLGMISMNTIIMQRTDLCAPVHILLQNLSDTTT